MCILITVFLNISKIWIFPRMLLHHRPAAKTKTIQFRSRMLLHHRPEKRMQEAQLIAGAETASNGLELKPAEATANVRS